MGKSFAGRLFWSVGLLCFAALFMMASWWASTALAQEGSPLPTPSLTATAPAISQLATPTPPWPVIELIIPAETNTPAPPSLTPTITNTPGPFEHVIQPGETLISIVQLYGHRSLAALSAVVALNANVPNADTLPGPGQIILIPRPTATLIPPGSEATATFIAQNPPTATPEILTTIQSVEEGQAMVSIVESWNTTMLIMRILNPSLDWSGCDFTIPSGGENCSPLLTVGQELVVPAFTPTPTLSPTPSGSETPTPTPVRGPVLLNAPAPGVILAGGPVVLSWVSAGILQPEEVYQVTVVDHTASLQYVGFTRDNSLTLPNELQPTDGASHDISWEVVVALVRSDNRAIPSGFPSETRRFQWVAP